MRIIPAPKRWSITFASAVLEPLETVQFQVTPLVRFRAEEFVPHGDVDDLMVLRLEIMGKSQLPVLGGVERSILLKAFTPSILSSGLLYDTCEKDGLITVTVRNDNAGCHRYFSASLIGWRA